MTDSTVRAAVVSVLALLLMVGTPTTGQAYSPTASDQAASPSGRAPGDQESVPASATADYDEAAAEGFISDYTSRHGLPGAAYVVVRNGEVVTTGADGDVSPTTPMSLGSVSKSFTAFAVLQLVDEGEIDLDAPITDYIPSFSVRGGDASAITVRMLLSHTSGLPNPVLVEATGSLAEDVANIAEEELASAPGSTYAYSNLNFRTLARLVEVVADEHFDSYLDENIFTPLGMEDTQSIVRVDGQPGVDAGHITAYGLALPLPELATDIGGSGGVITTAEDMGRWLAMQQRGGTAVDGTRLLSDELIEQSHTPQPPAEHNGLGWQTTSTDPVRVGHSGSLMRYSAREDIVPSNGYATAVLTDSFTAIYEHPFEMSSGLIDIAEGDDPDPGVPLATIVDLVLGGLTLLVIGLGIRGLMRRNKWPDRRSAHPWWRRVLRLLPQAIMPAVVTVVFAAALSGRGNPATPLDVFGVWPAVMVLLIVAAIVGVVLIIARVRAFVRPPAT